MGLWEKAGWRRPALVRLDYVQAHEEEIPNVSLRPMESGGTASIKNRLMKATVRPVICIIMPLLALGCASTREKHTVNETLQKYQVGVTKYSDFRNDTGLVELEAQNQTSYLTPQPQTALAWAPQTHREYKLPKNSQWKIYQIGESVHVEHWKITANRRFVVGDRKTPLCILSFNEAGILTDKSPVP